MIALYSGPSATTGPDHGRISEIAGYVNHHANSIYNVVIISTAVSLSIVGANNCRILAFSGFERSKFHPRVFQRSSTATLLRAQHAR